jgi:thiosulfate/3-mercaptopyruvate sulfurtransferase
MRRITAVCIASLLLSGGFTAADPLLITASQLAGRLDDPKIVLLHVGEKAGYDIAHIPGARFADLRMLHTSEDGLTLQMLAPELLRERLAALGISDDSRIVVYAASAPIQSATRVMLTLHWAGFNDVSFLDGGLAGWTREGRPVNADVPVVRAGSLSPLKVRPIVVDAAFVEAQVGKPGIAVVDARLPAFYDGTQTGGNAAAPHKSGHITGAVSVPFATLVTADGLMKSEAELRELFSKAGIKKDDTVVAYCHIGQQATAVIFAARLLGHKVALYDGSFEDWSRRNLPVQQGKLYLVE